MTSIVDVAGRLILCIVDAAGRLIYCDGIVYVPPDSFIQEHKLKWLHEGHSGGESILHDESHAALMWHNYSNTITQRRDRARSAAITTTRADTTNRGDKWTRGEQRNTPNSISVGPKSRRDRRETGHPISPREGGETERGARRSRQTLARTRQTEGTSGHGGEKRDTPNSISVGPESRRDRRETGPLISPRTGGDRARSAAATTTPPDTLVTHWTNLPRCSLVVMASWGVPILLSLRLSFSQVMACSTPVWRIGYVRPSE